MQRELDNYMSQRISLRQQGGGNHNLSAIHGLYLAEMHQ